MKRPTIAQLQAEIEALKLRLAMLEARPVVVQVPMRTLPSIPWVEPNYYPPAWPPGTIICGVEQ